MTTETTNQQQLIEESQAIWDEKAAWWDAFMGDDGNDFHRKLIRPPVKELLDLKPGERVLDAACGNGLFARHLASEGIEVVAFDSSQSFLDSAKVRGGAENERIDYRRVDATDLEQMLTLGEAGFDAAVCLMAIMDLPVIEPFFQAIARLLKPTGRFVFATSHPAFSRVDHKRIVELDDSSGEIETVYSIKIAGYNTAVTGKGVGVRGEPAPHYYFDRPLHQILKAGFQAGLVVDGLEEPTFEGYEPQPERPFSWVNYMDIPPALVVRMRRLRD